VLALAVPYALVALLALTSLGIGLSLRHTADGERREQIHAARLAAEMRRLTILEQEALAEGRVTPGMRTEWRITKRRIGVLAAELTRRDAESGRTLNTTLASYASLVDEEWRLLERGDVEEAEEVDERRAHPALAIVDARLQVIDSDAGRAAAHANRSATIGSVLAFVIAALLISLLVWRAQRSGRGQAVAAAEETTRDRTERRFRGLIENAGDMILVVDPHGEITLATGGVEAQLGCTPEALEGTRFMELIHPDDAELALPLLAEAFEHRPRDASIEWRMAKEGGSFAHVHTVARDLSEDESVQGLVLTSRDVSERKAFEDQLLHQAFHDPLTQLPNRALFDERVAHALARDPRDDRYVAVLFIDLDDFKAINDSLGSSAADQLLIGVAGRIRGCLRSSDTAARLGGDEFGSVLESLGNPAEAVAAA
jgi:PAS domain S-box-containing protein